MNSLKSLLSLLISDLYHYILFGQFYLFKLIGDVLPSKQIMRTIETKYNGWTNYATWRINLEIIEDIEFETHQTAEDIKEIVESVVFDQLPKDVGLVYDYAEAFIDQVNFYEIAEHVNENQILA